MKILIEASEAYRNNTGIGRFSRALIDHLPPELNAVYSPPDYATRRHTTVTRTFPMRIANFAQHASLTQWQVVNAARREKPDLIHSLSFFVPLLANVPVVNTIFDLAYFDLPSETDRFWGAYGRRMMPVFARRAAAILTTSDVSKAKIVERFGVDPTKVHRVYGGVDARFQPVEDDQILTDVRQRYGLDRPFVLYAGSWKRTKNLPVLVKAFAGIQDADLVLTGQPHADDRTIPNLAQSLNIPAKFPGYVPDVDLPALYTLARTVVLPSLYEGFGLTVIEAMACGTPVIISDIPVLREIAAGNAPHFPTHSPDDLRAILRRLLDDEAYHADLRARSLAHAQNFSWATTAKTVVDVWRQVAR